MKVLLALLLAANGVAWVVAGTVVPGTRIGDPQFPEPKASGLQSMVAGGYYGEASGELSMVAGGYYGKASGTYSMVAGGSWDSAIGKWSMVAGGASNKASGEYSMVAGGEGNEASGEYSMVAGGYRSTASGRWSMVAGGYRSTASGEYSMVAGGMDSNAEATRSIAIGNNVKISSSASNAVAVSATYKKRCETTEPGSLTLCADKNVTIEGSALVVNGVDVLMTIGQLEAKLLNTTRELADLKVKTKDELADLANMKTKLAALEAQVVALTGHKTQTQTSPASVSLVGTLLALSLTAAAVA
jgi:hypothetical protein